MFATRANLVDEIWEDQPPPPNGSARVHRMAVAGEEAGDKRARIGARIAEAVVRWGA